MGVSVSVCRTFVLGAALLVAAPGAMAELVMTAPPRETPEAGQELYGPLADYLTELFGEEVTYRHPQGWVNYANQMRDGAYDIVFDGPHFISWRMVHVGHTPVVRAPDTLDFYIVAKAGDEEVTSVDDLIGRKVCGLAPPNLATLSVYAALPNPVRQPILHEVKGSFVKVVNQFMEGECKAAVMRTLFHEQKMNDAERRKVKIVYESPSMPNQGFSVSEAVTPEMRKKMVEALTTKGSEGVQAARGILNRFGGRADAFIEAKPEEFEGLNYLLEGVVYGW